MRGGCRGRGGRRLGARWACRGRGGRRLGAWWAAWSRRGESDGLRPWGPRRPELGGGGGGELHSLYVDLCHRFRRRGGGPRPPGLRGQRLPRAGGPPGGSQGRQRRRSEIWHGLTRFPPGVRALDATRDLGIGTCKAQRDRSRGTLPLRFRRQHGLPGHPSRAPRRCYFFRCPKSRINRGWLSPRCPGAR